MFRLTRVDLRPRLSAKNFPFMAAGFVIVASLLQTLMFSKSRRADSNRYPALSTSLLEHVLACTSASGSCAYLCGFCRSHPAWPRSKHL
jgi:hypothetical protein